MQKPTFILYAIPFFFLLIGIEILVNRLKRAEYYRVNSAISDLSAGIMSELSGILTSALYLAIYFFIYENVRISKLLSAPGIDLMSFSSPLGFSIVAVACFILQDHQYYWWHRLSHEVGFMWAAHVVHHSSEEFNLATALRQSGTTFITNPYAYAPLVFLGFHPFLLMACSQINNIYQFWIHTRTINKFPGWFEAVFNTPSHHRVHHGKNLQYIDRNYAGTLIVWDKLYGSFEPEGEEVVYGITTPLNTWSPIWAQIHFYHELWILAWNAPRFRDKFLVWFKHPGWRPEGMGPPHEMPAVSARTYKKFGLTLPTGANLYVIVQFVIAIGMYLYLPLAGSKLTMIQTGCMLISVALVLASLGSILNGRKTGFYLEFLRIVSFGGAGILLSVRMELLNATIAVGAVSLLSLVWLWGIRKSLNADPQLTASHA